MDQENGIDLTALIDLVHHRWNIPIVAELHARSGAKFVTLVNSLELGRSSLSSSLHNLIELEIVRKNVGHGHPMRPEYLLTDRGHEIGADCEKLVRAVKQRRAGDFAFQKWTLPLIAAIGNHVARFNELRTLLDDASPRAVTLALKTLLTRKWIARNIIDDYPPAAGYELLEAGRPVLKCVNALTLHASRVISATR